MTPIQIRSQLLRQEHAVAPPGAASGFAMMPDGGNGEQGKAPPRGDGSWREADLKRAIAAAQEAGLSHYAVEIAPDGTIAIVVGINPDDTGKPARATRSAKRPKG